MEGKLSLLVIVLLVRAIVAYPRHNRIPRHVQRHQNNACNSIRPKMLSELKTDTYNIKQHLCKRYGMDHGTCSDTMSRKNDKDQTDFELGSVCNSRFFNSFRTDLREFYMNMIRICWHITALQADLMLFQDDPLLPLTNKLTNDIGNALHASQSNVALSLTLPRTYTNELSGVSGMLIDLVQTVNNIDNFVVFAIQILKA